MSANERDRLFEMTRILADAPVGPAKVFAPRGAEHRTGRFGFGEPLLDGAVAPHLSARQIAEADAHAERRMFRDGAAEPDLQVVGMRTKDEKIDLMHGASVARLKPSRYIFKR